MIIITGHEVVAAEPRDGFVEAFRDLVARARAFDGCLHFAGPRVPKPKSVVITRYDATPADAL